MGSISLRQDTNSGTCLKIPELWLNLGVSLFYTKDVAGLVNTSYLTGCCDMISMQPWIKVK